MHDPEAMRAGDDDRESTLALLRQASLDGRLTIEELAQRAGTVQRARTHGELSDATADLAPAAPEYVQPEPARAILSRLAPEGRWRLGRSNRFEAVLGRVRLDLREAVLPGPEVEIELHAVLGAAEALLPEHVHVEVTCGCVLSSANTDVAGEPLPGAPTVRIRCSGALCAIHVHSVPR